MSDSKTHLTPPSFETWQQAHRFAHEEMMLSFEALSHGDIATARALNESASVANALAAAMLKAKA